MKNWNVQTRKKYSELHDRVQSIGYKTETNDAYAILSLKKNVRSNITKTILGCSSITAQETFKEWKLAIMLVR